MFDRPEDEKLSLDKEFIRLSKEMKRLFGKPVDDPEVQQFVAHYIQETIKFVGKEGMEAFSQLEDIDVEQLENIVPSPFSKEEDEWLNQVMEHYMLQNGMTEDDGAG
ncbi:hypothetical protein J9303_11320 [Bacillaceae bacterium Marseille-Q3522]|nr:hypothetical protein [Bacillaceae bacterium Marseille-Q3522]